jgi:hypothetical protein
MNDFLAILEQHWLGVLFLILLLLVLLFLIRELFWLMGWGRYARTSRGAQANLAAGDPTHVLSFFTTTFLAKTISEFRHLLALLIFLLFAGAVILAILPGLIALNVEQMTEGLEGVAAALGGLVGSIIGYYFGEQVGSAAARTADRSESRGEAIQDDANTEIQPARIPAAPAPADNTGPIE